MPPPPADPSLHEAARRCAPAQAQGGRPVPAELARAFAPSAIAARPARAQLLAGAACVLLLTLLTACRQAAPPTGAADTDPPATATAAPQDKKEEHSVDAPKKQSQQPPAPDAVMYFIYNKDGDGATSYEIENGSIATYWYGHEFDLGGKHYFAGFAYNTPQKFGASEEENYPDPDARVTLTNATFLLSKPGTEKPWSFVGAELWIGEFGGYEKADEVDGSRSALSHETPDGQLLLAVPTRSFQSGQELAGYALFRFQPGELEDVEDRHWRYLGTVDAGGDNAAACDEGEVMPCVSSTGTLTFEQGAGGLPDVVVNYEGTTIESPGKTRELGERDRAVYRYVPDRKQYVAQ